MCEDAPVKAANPAEPKVMDAHVGVRSSRD